MASDSHLELLPWDSAHFGFRVARIVGPDASDECLRELLTAAASTDVRLVYWAATAGRPVSDSCIKEFNGLLADRKVTYSQTLCANPLPPAGLRAERPRIVEFPLGPATPGLIELAIAAGQSSRFHVDPRIPQDRFRALYTRWIERSTRREIADAVLVAVDGRDTAPSVGMVTCSVSEDNLGNIGLLAVHESARRSGIGARLVEAAHADMIRRGASASTVVTQRANEPACQFYERLGYRPSSISDVYHFWPYAVI